MAIKVIGIEAASRHIRKILDAGVTDLGGMSTWRAWMSAENPSVDKLFNKILAEWKKTKRIQLPVEATVRKALKADFLPRKMQWGRTHTHLTDALKQHLRTDKAVGQQIAATLKEPAVAGNIKGMGKINIDKIRARLVQEARKVFERTKTVATMQVDDTGAVVAGKAAVRKTVDFAKGKLDADWVKRATRKIVTGDVGKKLLAPGAKEIAAKAAAAPGDLTGFIPKALSKLFGKGIGRFAQKHPTATGGMGGGLFVLAMIAKQLVDYWQVSQQAELAPEMARAKIAMEPNPQLQLEQALTQQVGAGTSQMYQQAIQAAAATGIGPDELRSELPTGTIHSRIP